MANCAKEGKQPHLASLDKIIQVQSELYQYILHWATKCKKGDKKRTVFYQKSDLNKLSKAVVVRGKKSSWFIIATTLEH